MAGPLLAQLYGSLQDTDLPVPSVKAILWKCSVRSEVFCLDLLLNGKPFLQGMTRQPPVL